MLPACSHIRSTPAILAFQNLANPESEGPIQAVEPACVATGGTENPDTLTACAPPSEPLVRAEPAPKPRPVVEEALGQQYALVANLPNPPLRPGSAVHASTGHAGAGIPAKAGAPPALTGGQPLVTGSLASRTDIGDPRGGAIQHHGPIQLADAVAYAVLTYPEIRAYEARVREARAGMDISKANLYPNADLRLAGGENFSGSYEGVKMPYSTASNALDRRFDGGLLLRQLVFDFGAAGADIERARLTGDSEKFRLREKIDEIAWRTAQTYVKILEHRTLVGLVDETIASHQHLLKIVTAQEKEGHGTSADVNRVKSRLTDITTIRADVSLQLKGAEDQFERLTRLRPNRLGGVPNYRARIPLKPEIAIEGVLARNPRLAAMVASNRATAMELESQRANTLPKFNFELDSESKNFRNAQLGRAQIEARGMLSMRFKLLDGGLSAAQERQLKARMEGGEMLLLNEREQFEADIRQAYRAIESAGRKGALLADGVASAKKVRELYLEQFKAGKRTIFELLDGQMAHYTARRAQIESQFEINKAAIDILRTTGELTPVLAGSDRPSPPKLPLPARVSQPREQPLPPKSRG